MYEQKKKKITQEIRSNDHKIYNITRKNTVQAFKDSNETS